MLNGVGVRVMRSAGTGGDRAARRGAKLAEVALFLAISMAIVVGGLVTYREASVAATVGAQVQVLTAVMAESRAALARFDMSGGRLDTILLASNAVPAKIVAPEPFPYGSRLRTEWDTELAIGLADLGAGPRLFLRLHDIPVPGCTRLAPAQAGGQGVFATGLRAISVQGPGTAADAGPPPWSVSRTAELCSNAGAGPEGRVTVTFQFDPY